MVRYDKRSECPEAVLPSSWCEHFIAPLTQLFTNNNNNNNNRHDWVGKMIHTELYKKFKFAHTKKWNMLNTESVLKNKTHKLQWDFGIQTNHQIPAGRPDVVIMNKKRELTELCTLLSRLTTE